MGVLFDVVRASVSAKDAAIHYGLTVNQFGKARCPWHNDTRPSLSFKGSWCKCFACNNGGSAIDLVAQLFTETPLQAAERINRDFRIGGDKTPIQTPGAVKRAAEREQARRENQVLYNSLVERERYCKTMLESYGPEDAERPEFVSLLRQLGETQDRIELLKLDFSL